MKAMLLAAGEGKRLRPLTLETPKPLLPVAGKALIEYHVERLVAAGVHDLVINLHHFGERIREHLGNGERWGAAIEYSHERELLEVGGGILKALDLLGPDPFIVVSADLLTDFDFTSLVRRLPDGVLGHLVMVDNPPHHPSGDFGFTGETVEGARCLSDEAVPRLNYAGMALLHPGMFRDPPGECFPLRPLLDRAIVARRLTGEYFGGVWINIGTEAELTHAREIRRSALPPDLLSD